MDTWYTKALGDGIMASAPAEEIRQAFERATQAGGASPEMAVFTRLEWKAGYTEKGSLPFPRSTILPDILAGDRHHPETA